jgi:hypothetical protein
MYCFGQGDLHRELASANAYHLREQARVTNAKASQERSRAFLRAAEAFLKCASTAVKEEQTFLHDAGECYEQGGNDIEAAHIYLKAQKFTRAALLYRKVGMFDEAVKVVQEHKGQMDPHVAGDIIHDAQLYYFKEQILKYVYPHPLFTSPLTLTRSQAGRGSIPIL